MREEKVIAQIIIFALMAFAITFSIMLYLLIKTLALIIAGSIT